MLTFGDADLHFNNEEITSVGLMFGDNHGIYGNITPGFGWTGHADIYLGGTLHPVSAFFWLAFRHT